MSDIFIKVYKCDVCHNESEYTSEYDESKITCQVCRADSTHMKYIRRKGLWI